MGETTIDTSSIVASNLTIAYCATHPDIDDYEKVIEVYRHFLELLTRAPPEKKDRYDENESQSSTSRNFI